MLGHRLHGSNVKCLTYIMMVRLGYCLIAVIFNLATERMGQISGGHILLSLRYVTMITIFFCFSVQLKHFKKFKDTTDALAG